MSNLIERKLPPSNSENLLRQAYSHPKFSGHRFREESVCPSCGCELLFLLRAGVGERTFSCQNCFSLFKDVELAA